MRGGITTVPTGAIGELLAPAEKQGSVTVAEIADVLDTSEVSVTYEAQWSVNTE